MTRGERAFNNVIDTIDPRDSIDGELNTAHAPTALPVLRNQSTIEQCSCVVWSTSSTSEKKFRRGPGELPDNNQRSTEAYLML